MKRVIIHWTGGTNQPNRTEYEHYHYLINGDGLIVKGKYKPEDNLNCKDGKYAQHTGGGNTGAIGVAMCGMADFESRSDVGNYPLTKKQCEATFELVAKLCIGYDIDITSNNVMTHYEFGKRYYNTSSTGKIDIIYLPPYPEQTPDRIGNFIRNKIRWYKDRILSS